MSKCASAGLVAAAGMAALAVLAGCQGPVEGTPPSKQQSSGWTIDQGPNDIPDQTDLDLPDEGFDQPD